jgi:chaperone modulatory protein CbpM
MSSERTIEKILVGEVLGESDLVSLADLCRSCTVETQTVTTLVSEGILDPMGRDIEHWQFSVGSLRRVKTVIHLQRDLGVNLAGAALALDLMDRIAELERR